MKIRSKGENKNKIIIRRITCMLMKSLNENNIDTNIEITTDST